MENRLDAQFRPASEGVMNAAPLPRVSPLLTKLIATLLIVLAALSAPAMAHKGEKHGGTQQTQQAQGSATPSGQSATTTTGAAADGGHDMMSGMEMDMAMDRSQMSLFERFFDWLGRVHPFLVHFPIAFFPAALLTALVGRRRPSFAAPVQFLVVAGGLFAPLSAATGWLGGMSADPEPILAYHRWLGLAVGVGGFGLGIWAWRRPWEDRGAGMILALTIMTIAIAVQGFLGAGLTHGIEHLMF